MKKRAGFCRFLGTKYYICKEYVVSTVQSTGIMDILGIILVICVSLLILMKTYDFRKTKKEKYFHSVCLLLILLTLIVGLW